MADVKLDGLGVALITPFHNDNSIDFQSLEKVINHIIKGEADYIVVLGTTAETPTLTPIERKEIAKFVVEKTQGKIPLVLGIGGNCTQRVLCEIQHFDLSGYMAILSVTPYYNKPTQEGLFQHFKSIADSSPLPVILYNVPGRTGVNITHKTTLRLAKYSSKIIGIKEASGNILQCKNIIENAPKGFMVISGDDSSTCELMSYGARGVISVLANAFPSEIKNLVNQCLKKNFESARKCQDNINPFIKHLFEEGNPAGVKAVLANLGFIENHLRLPLVPVSKTINEKLIIDIQNFIRNH